MAEEEIDPVGTTENTPFVHPSEANEGDKPETSKQPDDKKEPEVPQNSEEAKESEEKDGDKETIDGEGKEDKTDKDNADDGFHTPEEGDEEEKEDLDEDEIVDSPAYIPKTGAYYMHDLRTVHEPTPAEATKKSRADGAWSHDRFNQTSQAPKTKQQIINRYGFDIRYGETPEEAAAKEESDQVRPKDRRPGGGGRGRGRGGGGSRDQAQYEEERGDTGGGGGRGGRRGMGRRDEGRNERRDEGRNERRDGGMRQFSRTIVNSSSRRAPEEKQKVVPKRYSQQRADTGDRGAPPMRQPTDTVYFDPHQQVQAARQPPPPREKKIMQILPPS